MKRTIIGMAAAVVLACSLAACSSGGSGQAGSSDASSAASASSESAAAVESGSAAASDAASSAASSASEAVDGGWQASGDYSGSALTGEYKELFQQALDAMPDQGSYDPVVVLADQVVAGTNFAYLAKETSMAPEDPNTWAVAVVYNDLEGKAEMTSVASIDLADVSTLAETPQEPQVGGWNVHEVPEGIELPPAAKEAFDKAMEGYSGVAPYPLALLGTQVVAGTNYLFLCVSKPQAAGESPELFVATIYQDPSDACSVSSMAPFDLIAYVGGEETQ